MQPTITKLTEKKLVGMSLGMSLAQNRTAELWRSFMPRRSEIGQSIGQEFYAMQLYPAGYFEPFSPQTEFVKWAAVEVSDFENIPSEMKTFELVGGLYAVFQYKGLNTDTSIFQYIYGTWLPNSAFSLDHRPHFEVLGEKYKNNDPESEEEIWIPIKPK